MSLMTPLYVRLALLVGLVSLHWKWISLLTQHVPEPYLDEVFHIPQAQAYWAGRWTHWDDKITTPPGLYLWSYVVNSIWKSQFRTSSDALTVENLRISNAVLLYVLWLTLYLWADAARKPVDETDDQVLKRLVVVTSPLLAFFSGLYYTDVFSAWTVFATLAVWEASRSRRGLSKFLFQIFHVLLGLLSLGSRQTNIFWVAVFAGGLQVVDSVQSARADNSLKDPEIDQTKIEDIVTLVLQLVPAVLVQLPTVLLALWPQLTLLSSFAAFVFWNGGVVLGDKSNHIATIHLPQLLYIWPCFVFFSWPALLPRLSEPQRLIQRLPRVWLALALVLAMGAAVQYNTIVHPFTLADNRHYVFYVFRILTRKWWIKYAAVPAYFVCACMVLDAFAGGKQHADGRDNIVRLSLVLVWFASTALSLISAPLVEPRYFIVPWLVWRMYVPQPSWSKAEKSRDGATAPAKTYQGTSSTSLQQALVGLAKHSLWIEVVWYLSINCLTYWMFLNRGFTWEQEPGKTQRFMW